MTSRTIRNFLLMITLAILISGCTRLKDVRTEFADLYDVHQRNVENSKTSRLEYALSIELSRNQFCEFAKNTHHKALESSKENRIFYMYYASSAARICKSVDILTYLNDAEKLCENINNSNIDECTLIRLNFALAAYEFSREKLKSESFYTKTSINSVKKEKLHENLDDFINSMEKIYIIITDNFDNFPTEISQNFSDMDNIMKLDFGNAIQQFKNNFNPSKNEIDKIKNRRNILFCNKNIVGKFSYDPENC